MATTAAIGATIRNPSTAQPPRMSDSSGWRRQYHTFARIRPAARPSREARSDGPTGTSSAASTAAWVARATTIAMTARDV